MTQRLDTGNAQPIPTPPADVSTFSPSLAKFCAQLLDSKKLEEIVIFDVRDSLQITDYFVIASGLNPRHLKSSCDLLDRRIREQGVRRHGMEGYREGTWILVDYDTVVVHLFLEGQRRLYDLELLWGDSPRLEWTPLPSTG